MESNSEKNFLRPDNLLNALGVNFKELTEEERVMKTLLIEEYKKRGEILLTEVKRWREIHRDATLGDAIRALYKELEEER